MVAIDESRIGAMAPAADSSPQDLGRNGRE
jgi:hypothetical protein